MPANMYSSVNNHLRAGVLQPHIVHEFPLGTWVENPVVRSSTPGSVLIMLLSSPEVYMVSTTSSLTPVRVVRVPHYLGLFGNVEMGHDVFYAITGNWSVDALENAPGWYDLWKVDLRGVPADGEPVSVKREKLAEVL
ncbi:uncharacterized protein Z518_04210 [Rhinocladiella mackenziei CBS 650.93]|uniref:Uncharacterized protein n=1 Tax=Rhinocladiella mackenziei CBS 650.93 TaxID=1442369 RepID=A0A0D2JAU7_9EURO|nr:uncharacterized protein Z518_04210 [Rhinocladiella mackenziei CBS 650.93]KIX06235.1 hypothetical protein Z518_04210 [Rhinocladiella mackenziei CBS 650.93]